jgi:hypothetical protein
VQHDLAVQGRPIFIRILVFKPDIEIIVVEPIAQPYSKSHIPPRVNREILDKAAPQAKREAGLRNRGWGIEQADVSQIEVNLVFEIFVIHESAVTLGFNTRAYQKNQK